jgi:MFS transporter, ACS family, tartrate transporter
MRWAIEGFGRQLYAGLLFLAGCALVGAIVVELLRIDARREQASGEIAMAH